MAKKARKAKEPVRLRQKALSNGNISLYLDIYRNGQRQYEFLKLYLIPETASDPTAKERNKQTLIQANAIKAQRVIELTNNEAGVINSQRSKILLSDWLDGYKQQKAKVGKSSGLQRQIEITKKMLNRYAGEKTTLDKVNKEYCEGFLNYIQNEYVSERTHKPLTKFSTNTFYRILNGALNDAVRKNIIARNPIQLVELEFRPRKPESQRVYLDVDEVKRLIATECPSSPKYKQAFLFSCFCGLRYSDVTRLKWGNLTNLNGQMMADIRQKKTDDPIYQPLNIDAISWLPERGNEADNEQIFKHIDGSVSNKIIKRWTANAGINKHVTFHTARHTFAVLSLLGGADLYTTSKLLGHKDVRTTQIYAKIVDRMKIEAVNAISNLFH